jgi:hypothetical protein
MASLLVMPLCGWPASKTAGGRNGTPDRPGAWGAEGERPDERGAAVEDNVSRSDAAWPFRRRSRIAPTFLGEGELERPPISRSHRMTSTSQRAAPSPSPASQAKHQPRPVAPAQPSLIETLLLGASRKCGGAMIVSA